VIKIRPRLARLSNGWVLDRDMARALNIGLRALAPGGGGGRGIPLDRAPCGVGEASEPTPRASPDHGNKNNLRIFRSTVVWETLSHRACKSGTANLQGI